jgi:hypothetical protein
VDAFGWEVVGSVAGLVVAAGVIVSGISSIRNRKKVRERQASGAFIEGDASGSSFGNVYSDAPTFVRGNALRTRFWNVIHRSDQRRER